MLHLQDTLLLKSCQNLRNTYLKFGYYGISFKYERMLVHSFDRCYVATKFILPFSWWFKILTIRFWWKMQLSKWWPYMQSQSQKSMFLTSRYIVIKLYHLYIFIRSRFLLIIAWCITFWWTWNIFDITKFSKSQRRKEKYNCSINNRFHWLNIWRYVSPIYIIKDKKPYTKQ